MFPWHQGRTCEEKTREEQDAKEARIKCELALDERRLEAERALAPAAAREEDGEEQASDHEDDKAAEGARIAEERAREDARVRKQRTRREALLREKHSRDEDASTQTLKIYKACPGCGVRVEKTRCVSTSGVYGVYMLTSAQWLRSHHVWVCMFCFRFDLHTDFDTGTRCAHESCLARRADHARILEEGNNHHKIDCPHYRPPGRRA